MRICEELPAGLYGLFKLFLGHVLFGRFFDFPIPHAPGKLVEDNPLEAVAFGDGVAPGFLRLFDEFLDGFFPFFNSLLSSLRFIFHFLGGFNLPIVGTDRHP